MAWTLLATCLDLNASTAIQELMYCSIFLSTGNAVLASVLIFILFIYGMYRLNIPFAAALPLGIVLLYFFGFSEWAVSTDATGTSAFTSLLWISIMLVGGLAFLAFLKLKGRF